MINNLNDLYREIKKVSWVDQHYADVMYYQSHFEGNKSVTNNPRDFPAPSHDTLSEWETNKANLRYINLSKILVRTWTSILCGDLISRNIKQIPHKEIVKDAIDDYSDVFYAWVESSIVTGTQVIAPLYDADTESFDFWLPNPANTAIITDPFNKNKIEAVVEKNGNSYQFISRIGEGYLDDKGNVFNFIPRHYDVLPVVVGYGISDLYSKNRIYGRTMLKDAVDFSILQTNTAYNISLLGRKQTIDILSIIGDPSKLNMYDESEVGLNQNATLFLPENFSAGFLSPNPKIQETINILQMQNENFAKIDGLPLDFVNPNIQNSSAEAARIRALPLYQASKKIIPQWLKAEKQLIMIMAYLVECYKHENAIISFSDIKKNSEIEIKNNNIILPQSPNERTQNNIALVAAGIKSLEDAIREEKPNITEEELQVLLEEKIKKLEEESEAEIADNSYKQAKFALTDQQISVEENK